MNTNWMFRVTGGVFSVCGFIIAHLSQATAAAPGDDPNKPLVLRGYRGGDIHHLAGRVITITDCVLDRLPVIICDSLTITDSILRGPVWIHEVKSLSIRNCEFHHSFSANLTGGGNGAITESVFTVPLEVDFDPGSPPAITRNSFLGKFQAVQSPRDLPLPDNYWGTSSGPDYLGRPYRGWLQVKGAYCELVDPKEKFLLSGVTRAATHLPDAFRPHPWVWVNEARVGQNVLRPGPYLGGQLLARQGRDLLVCLDLKTSVVEYAAEFTLTCNGHPVGGSRSFAVRRVYPIIQEGSDNQARTLNFVIPAWMTEARNLVLELKMTALDVAAYAGQPKDGVIWQAEVQPQPRFGRRLRLGVMPVNLEVPFWITAKADSSAARQRLEGELPALWPLLRSEFTVVQLPPLTVSRGYLRGAATTIAGGNLMPFMIARSASSYLNAWNASRPPERWLDRLVCVVPNRALTGLWGLSDNAGAALEVFSAVVMVEEDNPEAVLHELGHTLGLYLGTEQYDFTTTDHLGNPIAQVQYGSYREWNGAMVQSAVLFNDLGYGGIPRILHVPPRPTVNYYDFMGASTPQWIIPTSLDAVYKGLRPLLGSRPASGALLAGAASEIPRSGQMALMGPPPPGHRRVLFTGLLRRYQDRNSLAYSYRTSPDTVRIRDVSLEDFNLTEGNRGTWQLLECLDADGQPVTPRIPIRASLPDPAQSPVDPDWFQVVDVPVATARFAITDQELQGFEFLSVPDDGIAFQPSLAANPGSGALTGKITLDFGPSVGGKPLPVFHQLYYSADGRLTWVPIGEMTTDQAVALEARDLPATEDLSFKVVAADAFRSAQAQLTGFRVGNRAPAVRILSPQPGDAAESDQEWFLSAEAFDLEDGLLAEGAWHSSRDGLLGTNAVLPFVRLSAGEHTLDFTTTDAAGLAGSASVQVSIGPVAAADLALVEDSLRIRPAGSDPLEPTPNRLQTDRLNLIRIVIRNGGLTNEAQLSLYLTLENAPEVLLASTVVTNWAPFMPGSLEVPYVFPGANHYTLRAVISDPLVPDPDAANNSRSWGFTNQPPVATPARFDLTPQDPLDFRLSGADPDGDPLEYRLVTGPTRGVLERRGDVWRYRPLNAGQDNLSFAVSDGRFESPPATVTFFTTTTAASVPVPPSIVSVDRVFGTVGEDFSHAVVIAAPPATFAAYGLPAGLHIHPTTGLISGRPSQTGEFTVFVEVGRDGVASTQELRLRVQDTYARWIASFGLTGGDAAPESNPDADGFNNLAEYAHQLNPIVRDFEGGPTASRLAESGVAWLREVPYLVVTYRQRKGGVGNPARDYWVDGVRHRLEYNDHLDDRVRWAGGEELFEVLESRRVDNGDGTEWISVRCRVPITDAPSAQGYVRLQLALP
ncbi:MAG: putative Ig domain-containing protein [Verrucomicrobiales bacterium]|nr:putative Ig domain-containing protein [Verrucomicrobiales bacterium]